MAFNNISIILMVLGFTTILSSVVIAIPGTATFYNSYTPSACYGNQDKGVMIAAASDAIWGNKAACGRMYRVRCTGAINAVPHPCKRNEVTVKIVDHCPGCGGTIDLSKEAFAAIANPVAGIIKIDYTRL